MRTLDFIFFYCIFVKEKIMKPISIKKTEPEKITITWDDGHVSVMTFQLLRNECPCADCKGETILLKTYQPVVKPQLPGHYVLKSITPVGNYAIQIVWGDGHDTGLYSWEYLRKL